MHMPKDIVITNKTIGGSQEIFIKIGRPGVHAAKWKKKVFEKIEIKTKRHKNWPRLQNKKMTWYIVPSYTSWYRVGDEQSWAMAGRGCCPCHSNIRKIKHRKAKTLAEKMSNSRDTYFKVDSWA